MISATRLARPSLPVSEPANQPDSSFDPVMVAPAASEESVTSPVSESMSMASSGTRFSAEVLSAHRPAFARSPAPRPGDLPGVGVSSLRRTIAMPSRGGATVRDQVRGMQPTRVDYVMHALKQAAFLAATAGPFIGVGVGLTVGLFNRSVTLALGTSSLFYLLGAIMLYQGLQRARVNMASLSAASRPIELGPLRLEKEIAFWLRESGAPLRIRNWHRDRSLEAKHFAAFLGKLEMSHDFSVERSRPLVVARVRSLLDEMGASRTVRRRVFHIATEFAETCTDRVMLGLNYMELAISTRKAEKGAFTEAELVDKMRGLFRLEMLEKFAREEGIIGGTRERGGVPDDIEALVNLQMRLRRSLNLPLPRFSTARGSSELTLARLRRAEEFVQHGEIANFVVSREIYQSRYRPIFMQCQRRAMRDPGQWPKLAVFMAQNAAWGAHVVRNHPEAWRDHQIRAHHYQAALDKYFSAGTPSPTIFDGLDYVELSRRSQFYALHGLALEKALDVLADPPV